MTFLSSGHDVHPDQFEPGVPDSEQASAHGVDLTIMSWSLKVGYSIIDRLGMELRLPIRMSIVSAHFEPQPGEQLADDFQSIHHRDETLGGIGDLELRVVGGVLRAGTIGDLSMDLALGVMFPTGGVSSNPFALGRAGQEHQHIFFGGGTFRPTASLSAAYPLGPATLTLFGDAELSLYEGPEDYRPPWLFNGGLGVNTGFGLTDWRFMLQQSVFHEIAAEWAGERAENSGRTDLIASVGAAWIPVPAVQVGLTVRVPYYTFGAGDPIRIPAIFSLSVSYSLDTQE